MQHGAAQSKNFSAAVDGDRDLPVLIALLRRREKVLAPVLLPGDGAEKLDRRGRDDRLLGVERRLGAEAAADLGRDHADRFEIAFEQVGERAAAEVRRLRRRPHRQHVAARVVARQHGAAFERHGAAAVERELVLENVCGAREGGIDIAVAHGNDGRDVAREIAVRAGRVRLGGVAAIAHRRQDFELDRHGCRGVLGEIAALRDRHRNRLPDVADFAARQRELGARGLDRRIGHQHRDLRGRHARRQVVGGEHRMDARHRSRRHGVDRANPGVGVRAAHEAGMQRAGKLHVIDEATAACQQCRIFEAHDAGAEMLRAHLIRTCSMSPEPRNAVPNDTPKALHCNRDQS